MKRRNKKSIKQQFIAGWKKDVRDMKKFWTYQEPNNYNPPVRKPKVKLLENKPDFDPNIEYRTNKMPEKPPILQPVSKPLPAVRLSPVRREEVENLTSSNNIIIPQNDGKQIVIVINNYQQPPVIVNNNNNNNNNNNGDFDSGCCGIVCLVLFLLFFVIPGCAAMF